jgi:hypothetical protein
MRTNVSFAVIAVDMDRPRAVVKDRNAPQKHVWRTQIVLLSGEEVGTNAIMRATGKSKTCVWRWPEWFAAEGFDGPLRDKTRPARIAKLDPAIVERVVALTMVAPPHEVAIRRVLSGRCGHRESGSCRSEGRRRNGRRRAPNGSRLTFESQ